MAGLLGDSWDDPRTMATLQMAAGLLGGGNFGQALGRGLSGYTQSMSAAEEAKWMKEQQDWKRQEMEQAKQRQAAQQAFLQRMNPQAQATQQALLGGGGPTQANAANIKPVDPHRQMLWDAANSGVISAGDYLTQVMPKASDPFTLGEGQVRYDGNGKVVAQGPEKTEAKPADQRMYEYAVTQGFKGTLFDFKRELAQAGAARTTNNVSVNTEKNLLGGIATGVSGQINDSLTGAKAALGTLSTLDRLDSALSSGKVMVGPGTKPARMLMQIGTQMGVGGKDANDVLRNTQTAIQALAQLELDAASQMRGQGQITEGERALLRRAAGGDISMSMPELKQLSAVTRKVASMRIKTHNQAVQPLLSNPNAQALSPFLTVNDGSSSAVDFGSLK